MTTQYVIWERNRRGFIGGAQPSVFATSNDASAFVTRTQKHEKPTQTATYDVVAITTNP